jgi:hypothetical protein
MSDSLKKKLRKKARKARRGALQEALEKDGAVSARSGLRRRSANDAPGVVPDLTHCSPK